MKKPAVNFAARAYRAVLKIPAWLLITVAVLVVIRILLPPVCLWGLNRALDSKLGVYRGHIGDFDLSLYRGAYQIQDLIIEKRDGSQPPILKVREVDLSVAWRALFRKNISADVSIDGLQVRLADSENKSKKQTGGEEPLKNWEAAGGLLVPIAIETLVIRDSAVYFTNNDLKAPLPVALEKINLRAENLRSQPTDEMSPLEASALLQQHAGLWVKGELDLRPKKPRVDLDFKIEHFRPSSLNKMLRLYIPLDVTKGDVALYGELAAEDGAARGYAKFFLKDGDIIAPAQDYLGVKHFFIEIATAFANWLLKSNETRTIAARIPFKYDKEGLDIKASDAFWSAVKNRGDQLPREIENSVSLKPEAKQKEKPPASASTQ